MLTTKQKNFSIFIQKSFDLILLNYHPHRTDSPLVLANTFQSAHGYDSLGKAIQGYHDSM